MSNVTALKPRPTGAPVWLSPTQVCEHVPGMTVATLQDMRKRGVGPRFFKPTHKTVIYALADIDAWVAASAVTTREQS